MNSNVVKKLLLIIASSSLFFTNSEAKAFVQNPPSPFARVDSGQVAPGTSRANATWAEIDLPDSNPFRPAKSRVLLSPGRGYQEVNPTNKVSSGTKALNFTYELDLPNNSGRVFWDLRQITEPNVAGLSINSIFVSDASADGLANQSYATMAGNWKTSSLANIFEYGRQLTQSIIPIGSTGFVSTGFWGEFRYADINDRVDYIKIVSGFDASGPLEDFVEVETMFDNNANAFRINNASMATIDTLTTDVFARSPLVQGYNGGDIAIDLTFTANAYLASGAPITHPGTVVTAPAPLPILGVPIIWRYSRRLRAALRVCGKTT